MTRPKKAALIGAAIGTAYGLFYASQKYPAEWWTTSEGAVRVFVFVSLYAIVAAAIGYGIGLVRRNSN